MLDTDSSSDASDDRTSDWTPEVGDSKSEWDEPISPDVLQKRIIDLENKRLKAIPDELLAGRQRLVLDTVVLSFNSISELPVSFGPTLMAITELRLDGNELTVLPDSIGQLVGLKVLNLKMNRIGTLSAAIQNLTNLTTLSLENNRLTCLPEEFGQLRNLKHLKLCDNALQSLPKSFGQLCSLIELDVTKNLLSELPDAFGSLTSLTILILADNKLNKLPLSFASLPSVVRLDLSMNNLTSLCSTFQSCTRLEVLCLDSNPLLAHLPQWVSCMTNIRQFSCRSCSLTDSPLLESFGQMSSHLQRLDMGENCITDLPASLLSLSGLEILNLDTCPLTSIWCSDYKYNRLEQLPADFGKHFREMRELRLSRCSLTSLPEKFGVGLCSLQLLTLDGNLLSYLPDSLCLLSKLRELSIRQNRLQKLPDELGKLKSLTELILPDNDVSYLSFCFYFLTAFCHLVAY